MTKVLLIEHLELGSERHIHGTVFGLFWLEVSCSIRRLPERLGKTQLWFRILDSLLGE